MIGTRISADELTDEEEKEMIKFDKSRTTYPIKAGTKHQIVYDGEKDIGIAINHNGRQNFREFEMSINYYHFGGPIAWAGPLYN